MPKRGQAAMEFLMTYGWAILAVIISIAALAYFGVLNPSLFVPESVTLMPGLAAVDSRVIENAIILNVRNGMGKNLIDVYFTIPSCVSGNVGSSGHVNLNDGALKEFVIGCSTPFGAGKRVNADLEIHFTESSLPHTRTGKISGRAENGRLLAYYSFDNVVGVVVPDLSGSGNDGDIIDNAPIIDGEYGKALGISDSLDRMSISPNIDIGNDWSIEVWFPYPNNFLENGATNWRTLTRATGADHQVIVKASGFDLGTYDNTAAIFRPCTPTYLVNSLSSGWHNLEAVQKGGLTGKIEFYIDNIKVCEVSNYGSITDIGTIGNHFAGSQPFGTLDEVRIYNFAIR